MFPKRGVFVLIPIPNLPSTFHTQSAINLLFFLFISWAKVQIKNENASEEMSLGDIVLCMEVIEAHSVEYNTGFNREMLYMIVHGICHLLGYDHEIEEEKKVMRALEEKILEGCN